LDEAVLSAPFNSGMSGSPPVRRTTSQEEGGGVKAIAKILADLPADAQAQTKSCAEHYQGHHQSTEEPKGVTLGVGEKLKTNPAIHQLAFVYGRAGDSEASVDSVLIPFRAVTGVTTGEYRVGQVERRLLSWSPI
jgi:hypothetical protein